MRLRFLHDEEEHWLKKAKLRSEIDKILLTFRKKERTNYTSAVLKMYHDYEELVFNLSEQGNNETIESIKRMTLGQRLKYQELIVKRNQRLKPITRGEAV